MTLDHPGLYRRFLADIAAGAVDEAAATAFWREQGLQIAADASAGAPFDFLRWPGLLAFSVPDAWIPPACYAELREQPDWATRWHPLTRETKLGAPKDYALDFGTSPILVQHAYHLMRYEQSGARATGSPAGWRHRKRRDGDPGAAEARSPGGSARALDCFGFASQ